MNNRSGSWKSNLYGDMAYKSFLPASLPPVPAIDLDEDTLITLIDATKKISFLDGLASKIPSLPLFVSMYVRKEALLSSQIEGTQATLEDILDPHVESSSNQDVSDVINYIKATEYALQRLKEFPLCNRLIKEIHQVLMTGARGQEKSPGEFRTTQNWIGGYGSSLKNAKFIPPEPLDMLQCMSDLEKYIYEEYETNPLVKAALIHYQFETIHPFLDGNGRIGRLLITLYLLEMEVLSTPAIYISYFLKENRVEYYDRMMEVRNKGNFEQWVKFFLEAIDKSAEDAIKTIEELVELHEKNLQLLENLPRNKTLLALFHYLEKNPIIEIKKTASALNLSYNTIAKSIDVLIANGILKESAKQGRTHIYSYEAYLGILRKDT